MARFWRPGSEKPDSSSSYPSAARDDDYSEGVPFAMPSSYQSGYMSIEKQRQSLPIYKQQNSLLYLVENTSTTIVIGETGSGKTTQIPQYLVKAGWADGNQLIACTQPRRIAVQTVAARVAEEMHVNLGLEVGYSIRFEEISTPGVTKIKYLTDGVLIREMMEDPLLTKYSVIMVDEAHERSVSTDMLLGLLKKIQRRRPELRLIIASATIQATSIAAFFDNSKQRQLVDKDKSLPSRKPAILSVEGRSHTVLIHYVEEPVDDYLRAAVSTTLLIHKMEPSGDILVFLTGQDDVDAALQLISDEAENGSEGIFVLPLYAGLPRSDQELVFSPAPRGKRKIIVSTNIAETSVTLEGIVYVVDTGFSKQRFYNPIADVEALVVAPISRASAQQRAGRAGRVRPGKCFRLYTEDFFMHEMQAEAVPEVRRSSLVSTILQLKALGIDNIMRFDWLASPPAETMVRALELLYAIGVLDSDAKLTSPLGLQIAELPLEPMVAKMLLASAALGCSNEVLTISASLSVQSIWVSGKGRLKEFDEARERFAAAEGDLITYLNVYEAFLASKKSAQWCHQNCINFQAMKQVLDIRAQLSRLLQRLGIPLKSSGKEIQAIQKAVASGFFVNASQLEVSAEGDLYKTVRGGLKISIHPSSVLFRATPKWVVFKSVMLTDRHYMREVTAIDPAWLTEIAPHFFQCRK
ncbi:hypothetical protein O6H91_08G054000 [Diphasiastrum complanatum]|uniref:Uncharacterized protein n=1 Tax=Diphasiastrum complanatum TaxID=34168 RepID=A0ACC2CXV4_DIPCM|nr:hypothetical protein O6H91_08G054000 [Diphasiastrum complanatum]